jgi:hypothetical protein
VDVGDAERRTIAPGLVQVAPVEQMQASSRVGWAAWGLLLRRSAPALPGLKHPVDLPGPQH